MICAYIYLIFESITIRTIKEISIVYFHFYIMSEVNNSEWYALVKYKSGGKTKVLPVHKIRMKIGKSERIASIRSL